MTDLRKLPGRPMPGPVASDIDPANKPGHVAHVAPPATGPAPDRATIVAALIAAGVSLAAAETVASASCVPMEVDTSQRPPVVAWIAGGKLRIATPWKPASHLGSRQEPGTYLGCVTSGKGAHWGAIATTGGEMVGCWSIAADALGAGVLAMLQAAGWSVRIARDTANAVATLAADRAAAPMRVAKRRKRDAAGADLTGGTVAPSIDLSAFDAAPATPPGG